MPSTLNVIIPNTIKAKLDIISKREHMRKSEIVREALKKYFAEVEFQNLRKMVIPKAQKQGFFSDEDVFDAIS